MLTRLFTENQILLQQALHVLQNISSPVFLATDAGSYGSSCGSHFRHVIQHYQAFLTGLSEGIIDYDQRDRSVAFETDKEHAVGVFREIQTAFEFGKFDERPISVLQNYDPTRPKQPAPSSVARELAFLTSHTVHHYAAIALILKLNSVEPPQYFGFSPSTLYFLAHAG